MNTRDQSNVIRVKDILQISRLQMLCMSETLEMVFVAFTEMYIDTQCTAYMPLTPPRGRAPFKKAPHPVGSAVHHHAVQGGSFVLKCSGTCQTTRVIAGKIHSQSSILKCYGGHSATR